MNLKNLGAVVRTERKMRKYREEPRERERRNAAEVERENWEMTTNSDCEGRSRGDQGGKRESRSGIGK